MEGHAGCGKSGQDIVCAAESMLLYTLVDWLRCREALMHPDIYMAAGQARIVCRPEKGQQRRCREMLSAFYRGYELLGERYPQAVRTEKRQ